MNKEMVVFNKMNMEVRAINKNGEAWFVAKDVADILGYSNTEKMTRRLDEDEKLISHFGGTGQNRQMTIINESGLYSSVLGSKKPEAKLFKKWVTSEVLPAIRKDSGYIASSVEDTPEMIMAKAVMVAQATIKRNEEKILQLETETRALLSVNSTLAEKIEEDKPQVEFANQIANTSDAIDLGTFAKLINDENIKIGRNNLFKLLKEKGVLMSNNQPYQRYIDNGYFKTVEIPYNTAYGTKISVKTLITGKAQIKLVSKLREWLA